MIIPLLFMVGALYNTVLWTIDKTVRLSGFIITHILKPIVNDKPNRR